jgi:hypothetical protein
MTTWMTAIREHALNVRWCKRHVGTGRRYRGGKRRCKKCGYFLPTCGAGVFDLLLRRLYAPRLKRMLMEATPLLDLFDEQPRRRRVSVRLLGA